MNFLGQDQGETVLISYRTYWIESRRMRYLANISIASKCSILK